LLAATIRLSDIRTVDDFYQVWAPGRPLASVQQRLDAGDVRRRSIKNS
jgi:hypothetical protein